MRDLLILAVHLLVTFAKLLRPGGGRAVAAGSLLLKHQLLISNRSKRRAPNLTTLDRFVLGLTTLLVSPRRIAKLGALVKPATLLKFHQALVDRKYRRLFSSRYRRRKPGPKGPSAARIAAIVDVRHRNPRFGTVRIAQQIAHAFGVDINEDVVRRVLAKHYRPGDFGTDGPSWLAGLSEPPDFCHDVVPARAHDHRGANGGQMQANPPYYVSFTADRAPSSVDHSNRNPGPSDGKQRAGHTSFLLDARITVKWEDGSIGTDSLMPFFFEAVNVFFFLKDFKVQISSDYRVGSCPYRATLEHELESHVRRPTRMFVGFRDAAVRRLNLIALPTQRSPRRIGRGQGAATETALMRPVALAVKELKNELRRSLDDDRRLQDSPAANRAVHARCPANEWGARGL